MNVLRCLRIWFLRIEEKNSWDGFGYDYDQKTSNHKHKAYAREVYDGSFVDQWLYYYDLVKGNVKDENLLASYKRSFDKHEEMLAFAKRTLGLGRYLGREEIWLFLVVWVEKMLV